MKNRRMLWAGAGLTSVFVAALLSAAPQTKIEIPDWDNAVAFDVVFSQSPLRAGDDAELAILATIRPGYHLYGPEEPEPSRTKVTVSSANAEVGDVSYPAVIRRDLSGLGEFDLYEGEVAIRVPFTVEGGSSDTVPLSVVVNFQICTDYACSAPNTEEIELSPAAGPKSSKIKSLHSSIFKKKP